LIVATFDAPASFKALGGVGEFAALVSVFGNVDLQGDRVMPGAFKKSLIEWKAGLRKDRVPVLWSHDSGAQIGSVHPADMRETTRGLEVRGALDMRRRLSREAHSMMKSGTLRSFSFGFNEEDVRPGTDCARELHGLSLEEVSVTSNPANTETQLLSVKSVGTVAPPKPTPSPLLVEFDVSGAAAGGILPCSHRGCMRIAALPRTMCAEHDIEPQRRVFFDGTRGPVDLDRLLEDAVEREQRAALLHGQASAAVESVKRRIENFDRSS
jgi:HK97 family phage prohead protease